MDRVQRLLVTDDPYALIPPILLRSLRSYGLYRTPTGGFLRACLENDFVRAATLADLDAQASLSEIARFIFNELSASAWGSREKVNAWLGTQGPGYLENER